VALAAPQLQILGFEALVRHRARVSQIHEVSATFRSTFGGVFVRRQPARVL
jgi:hypothetical protein